MESKKSLSKEKNLWFKRGKHMNIAGFLKTTFIDFPDKVASMIFTQGCNLSCGYCHNFELIPFTNESSISEDEVLEHLEKRRNIIEGLVISGGEPTVQFDLPQFMKKVKELGLLIKLDTNGARPEIIQRLIEENLVDYIAMDVKATKDKYSSVTCKTNQEFEKMRESIDIIMNSSVDYEFRTTIIREYHSIDDIREMCEMINGAKNYYLQQYREEDSKQSRNFMSPYSKDELEDIKNTLKTEFNIKHVDVRASY